MYYRRKIILSLLQVFDNQLDKIALQKLLFLLSKNITDKKTYDFVPYKYGCFSFQANADLLTLKKYGIIEESENLWKKVDSGNYLSQITKSNQKTIKDYGIIYKNKTKNDLIKLTYKNFPYYAINSTLVNNFLSKQEVLNLDYYRSHENNIILFTIGYEGISLEKYLNKLLKNNIKVLCDVRKNARSMKYGFSKKQLSNSCEGVGIKYIHIPEVGIDSAYRKNLETQKDYDILFESYTKTTLNETSNSQSKILNLLKQEKRIALTCFEADMCQCHRSHLAVSISKLENFKYKIEHI